MNVILGPLDPDEPSLASSSPYVFRAPRRAFAGRGPRAISRAGPGGRRAAAWSGGRRASRVLKEG